MRKVRNALVLLGALMVAGSTGFGAQVEVTGVEFLSGKTITVPMTARENAPQALVTAEVQFKHGQSRIQLKYDGMKPAILFGGDVTSYVLWALTSDGRATNLGEVQARKGFGSENFYVGLKGFALIMTAEPYYMVSRPSDLIMFVGGPPKKDKSRSHTYKFNDLAMAAKHAQESVADLKWESKINLGLLQARKAYELAGRHKAGVYAKEAYAMAGSELAAAEMIAEKNPASGKIDNPARNCVQLSNTGINIAVRTEVAKEFRKMVMKQRAKLQTANERSEAAEYLAAALMNQTQELEAVLEEVESENIELYSLLEDAFSHIAMTRIDAARVVLTLPGIFFDTDRARLKPEAQVALAKMSGILMVFHRATVNIGGFTDSTGDPDRNQRLAKQRADSVKMFLFEQGVAEGRLAAVGFGAENPVGDNSTEKGRAMNRRVEMVIAVNQN